MSEITKISIIVPVYNTPEEEFKRCLRSVLNQEFNNYEIIVIDDGSEDTNSSTYKQFCDESSIIHYYKTNNFGVSHARNEGIRYANSEYISFVDADDVVSPSFLKESYTFANRNKADIVIGQIRTNPDIQLKQIIPYVLIEKDMNKILEYMFFEGRRTDFKLLGSPCGRLFKTEIAKQLCFDEELVYFEDQLFNRKFIMQSKVAVIVPSVWYIYYQNNFSAMHSNYKKWNELDKWILFWQKWDYLNISETDEFCKREFTKRNVFFFYDAVLEGIRAGESYDKTKISRLLDLDVIIRTVNSLKISDFAILKQKLMFIFMKYRLTFSIYLLMYVKYKFII